MGPSSSLVLVVGSFLTFMMLIVRMMKMMMMMMMISRMMLVRVGDHQSHALHHPHRLARAVLHQDPGLDVLLHRPLRMTGSSS